MNVIHLSTPLEIVSANLSDLIALPDQAAAEALHERITVLDEIRRVYERSYAERGIIAREFERRHLWRLLTNPKTGQPFGTFSDWMNCSKYLGCRRTNFEAKADIAELESDVPAEVLIDVQKQNIKVLKQLSGAVRKRQDVQQAARMLDRDALEEKIEKEHPNQHIEVRRALRFSPVRSDAKIIEAWIDYAIEHDIAATREEAIVRACELAMTLEATT